MARKVIKRSNIPTRSPVGFLIVIGLVLDRLNAAGWVWGVCGAVGALLLFVWIHSFVTENQIDLFNQEEEQDKEIIRRGKSTFQQRIDELKSK